MPRIFLQSAIDSHQIWREMEFWEGLIKYNINEELHNQKNYNMYTSETNEEKCLRIKNTALSQLNSFIYNMLSFEIRKDKIRDLVINFCRYHQIGEDQMASIFKNIEDYQYIAEIKVIRNSITSISSEDKPSLKFDEEPKKEEKKVKEEEMKERKSDSTKDKLSTSESSINHQKSDEGFSSNIILQQHDTQEMKDDVIDNNLNIKIKSIINDKKETLSELKEERENAQIIDQNFRVSKVLEEESDET